MIRIRRPTAGHRLRSGWASGLAAAISRRTPEAELRDAIQRVGRAMVHELHRTGEAAEAAATVTDEYAAAFARAMDALAQ